MQEFLKDEKTNVKINLNAISFNNTPYAFLRDAGNPPPPHGGDIRYCLGKHSGLAFWGGSSVKDVRVLMFERPQLCRERKRN